MNVTNRYLKYLCDLYEYYEDKINAFLKLYLGDSDGAHRMSRPVFKVKTVATMCFAIVFCRRLPETEKRLLMKAKVLVFGSIIQIRNKSTTAFIGYPRTSQWPFTKSPIPLLATFTLYYIIAFFGPRIMNSRKSFEIRKVLMIYNVGQIWLSSFIMKEIVITCTEVGFSLTCQPVDLSMNPVAIRTASISWWYHISKYVDLLDTVFFVLRKKGKQMTFLHLFHHSTMLFNSYLGMLYLPGGQAIVSTFLNSFVHVIMYWYYLLSAVGPCFHKYLWWKKYLTILQLTQFFTVLAHVFLGSVSGCEVPNWLKLYVICYVSVLIVLFLNFYLASYKKMSLLKALGCVCFQDHMKKALGESKDDPCTLGKEEMELIEKPVDRNKKEGVKLKSPFTIVNRNPVQDHTETLGDSKPKDKDL